MIMMIIQSSVMCVVSGYITPLPSGLVLPWDPRDMQVNSHALIIIVPLFYDNDDNSIKCYVCG